MRFNFARDALRYIIKENEIKEIYVPYYLCDVIRHAVVAEGAKPLFYHIDDDFMPLYEFSKDSFIIYPNYFGICDKNVDKLVVDNAHAYYASPKGFASIYSPHKFENYIKDRRQEFDKYHKLYGVNNQLNIDITEDVIPFCYPFLAQTIEEADCLVRRLNNEGKTVYRYWNALPESYNEYKFYSRLVPIPFL